MKTTTRLGALTAVVAAATLLTGCQEKEVVGGSTGATPSAATTNQPSATPSEGGSTSATEGGGAVGPDGQDSGRKEHLSDKGGYVVQGSKVTFVYSNGIRYVIDVGQPVGDQTTVKSGTGTLTFKNGGASWVDLRSRASSQVDADGAGTVIDKTGAIVVLKDGSTTCANGQGLQFVGSDGAKAQASKTGAFYVDAEGKKTSYGQPSSGGKLAGRFTVCNVDKKVSVDLYSDVLFDFNSATLSPAGKAVVASAAKTISKDVTGKPVSVVGHTDSKGTEEANKTLGQRRADAVAAELRTQLPGVQLKASSAGETEPVAANTTPDGADNPAGRAKNRRVTISYAR
ncbi:OmpA family protein [Luteipulveratus mongoliensis]|uniref:OmpA family protein n=1 Tax=Luteipulveratus mongoliensis TaxID=571913 RepID=UPI0006991E68|nr:OmpA family protein [Luteipulveratus mongoliensis]